MLRFRSRRFAMLLILVMTLSLALQGVMMAAYAADYDDPLDTKFYENTSPGNNAPGPLSIDMSGTPDKAAYIPGETARITVSLKNNGHGDRDGTNYDILAVVKDAGDSIIFNMPELNMPSVDNFNLAPAEEKTYDFFYTIPSDQPLGTLELPYAAYDYGLFIPGPSEMDSQCSEWMHTEVASGVIPLNIVEPGSITINKTMDPGYEGHKFVCFSLDPVIVLPPIGVDAQGFRHFRCQCVEIVDGSAQIVFENLPYGDYVVRETMMPRFYSSDLSEEPITINEGNLHPELAVDNSYTSPISIEKTVVPAVAEVGDEVTYLFKVKNIGDVNLFHVQLHDMDIPFDAYLESTDAPEALTYEGEFLEPGEIWETSTTHILTAEDMAGGSFTNTAKVTANTCYKILVIDRPAMNAEDISAFCRQRCILVEASDDATVTLPTVVPTPTVTEIIVPNDADPAGSFIPPEPVPLSAPVILPAEPVLPIEEEVIPLGVPVLPKTAELPLELFYGLGGMVAALGAYLKRK